MSARSFPSCFGPEETPRSSAASSKTFRNIRGHHHPHIILGRLACRADIPARAVVGSPGTRSQGSRTSLEKRVLIATTLYTQFFLHGGQDPPEKKERGIQSQQCLLLLRGKPNPKGYAHFTTLIMTAILSWSTQKLFSMGCIFMKVWIRLQLMTHFPPLMGTHHKLGLQGFLLVPSSFRLPV